MDWSRDFFSDRIGREFVLENRNGSSAPWWFVQQKQFLAFPLVTGAGISSHFWPWPRKSPSSHLHRLTLRANGSENGDQEDFAPIRSNRDTCLVPPQQGSRTLWGQESNRRRGLLQDLWLDRIAGFITGDGLNSSRQWTEPGSPSHSVLAGTKLIYCGQDLDPRKLVSFSVSKLTFWQVFFFTSSTQFHF